MKKSVLICGQAGQGVQTIGYLLAKALMRERFEAFAWQDFQSRIRGGESSFRIVFSDDGALSLPVLFDIIVSLDKRNSEVYRPLLAKGGLFVAAPGAETGDAKVPDLGDFAADASKKKFLNTAMAASAAALTGVSADVLENLISEEFADKDKEVVNPTSPPSARAFGRRRKFPNGFHQTTNPARRGKNARGQNHRRRTFHQMKKNS
ncbi:MAG: 2-oxoacid:acceptor oxidoreductase family protein [Endomicrobiia bacterium]|nr:2-oxoacid:acceptor oxidoreductase family protein [Endomicrobiia bacterium]